MTKLSVCKQEMIFALSASSEGRSRAKTVTRTLKGMLCPIDSGQGRETNRFTIAGRFLLLLFYYLSLAPYFFYPFPTPRIVLTQ